MKITIYRKMLTALVIAAALASHSATAQPAATSLNAQTPTIAGLDDRDGNNVSLSGKVSSTTSTALGDYLAVVLSGSAPLDPNRYILFLNGQPVDGLSGSYYDAKLHALVFPLVRNDQNKDAWAKLLGAPLSLSTPMTVALGERPPNGGSPSPTIAGAKGQRPSFTFTVLSPIRLGFALAFIVLSLGMVWLCGARRTGIMRDNYIPQIEASRQTYSLGRWQMAVWFSLVIASYVFLYILLGDTNTLTPQALTLMGISSLTALAAVTVDKIKDTPADAANQALKLLGINNYADVLRLRQEIVDRQSQLAASGTAVSATSAQILNAEIIDRQNKLRAYDENIAPFLTEGWWNDITTDQNGLALHRVQVVCWTLLLGAIFLIGVYDNLAMPEFSATLLALMGVSGSGYIGFKYPEADQ